jgi:hypothetical protein
MMSNTPILLFPVSGLFEFSVVRYSSATERIFSWNFPHTKKQLIRHRDNKIRIQVIHEILIFKMPYLIKKQSL